MAILLKWDNISFGVYWVGKKIQWHGYIECTFSYTDEFYMENSTNNVKKTFFKSVPLNFFSLGRNSNWPCQYGVQ